MQSRRQFLKYAGVGGAALAAVGSGVLSFQTLAKERPADAPAADHNAPGSDSANAEEMDRMHEQGMLAFPAPTAAQGLQPLEHTLEDGFKVFRLVARKSRWEVEPGRVVDAWTFNDMFPGPLIRVTEGDRLRIIVRNELDESTSIHWHGLKLPNNMDGVTYLNQPPIAPGATFTYEFTARNPGTHGYHSHHNGVKQVPMGLAGALVIDPQDSRRRYEADREAFLFLMDGTHGYTLNGKSFPATSPITAHLGERVRLRFVNFGSMVHPMHLHGLHMEVVEKDGYALRNPYDCDTLCVAPGERYDAIVTADEPGQWAFHCHVLQHAESEHGMFGMVTVFDVA